MAFTQWAAGMKITAARLAGITPKFKPWTPTTTTQTGLRIPTWGPGALNCRYAVDGDLVLVRWSLTVTSGSNLNGGGSGDNLWFSLPVAPAEIGECIGMLSLIPTAQTAVPVTAISRQDSTFYVSVTGGGAVTAATNYGVVDVVTPSTWVTGTTLKGYLTYERA